MASVTEDEKAAIPDNEGDLTLWRDLLRRARGDTGLALKWMNEIGVNTPSTNNASLQKDFDLAAAEAGAPATFYCPISFRVFRDPIMVPTGQTYERQYLEKWLAIGNQTCPATGQKLEMPVVTTPNVALRKSIEEWCATHVPWILNSEGQLKPIDPEEETHFAKTLADGRPVGEADDLALAISLQEDELENFSARTRGSRTQSGGRRRNRGRRRGSSSLLTCFLLLASLASTALFILSLWRGGWEIENLSVNPLVGPNANALSQMGSRVSSKIQTQHQWWRIPSSLFVSSGVIHLFSAVASLWTLGKFLEYSKSLLAPWLTVPLLFLISGISGAVASTSLAFDYDSAGASAGVCGLLGAVWMEQLVHWRRYKSQPVTMVVLAALTAMFVIISLLPLVGLWYQVVALACGALLLPIMLVPRQGGSASRQCLVWLIKIGCAGIVVGVIALGVVSVLADDSRKARACAFCRDIDCVDTRWWKCAAEQPLQAQASCQFTQNADATTTITCPSGSSKIVATAGITDRIQACNTACTTVVAFAPPPLAPDSAGVLI